MCIFFLNFVIFSSDHYQSNPWRNGILFIWSDVSGGGCHSAVGRADGETFDENKIEDYGAPTNWQVLALDDTCGGSSQATVEHEVLHAMGMNHEHNRPDRDDYIIVNQSAIGTDWESQFYKIFDWIDTSNQFPFEIDSIMTYCSYCGTNGSAPGMTLLNGETFEKALRMTTTDSRQVIWSYCRDKDDLFDLKETINCTSEDRIIPGLYREVYIDRICDGFADCTGAEDELGGLGDCIPFQPNTRLGCCSIIMVDGIECSAGSRFYNGRDSYQCADNIDHVVYYLDGYWTYGASGLPTGDY